MGLSFAMAVGPSGHKNPRSIKAIYTHAITKKGPSPNGNQRSLHAHRADLPEHYCLPAISPASNFQPSTPGDISITSSGVIHRTRSFQVAYRACPAMPLHSKKKAM